MNKQLQDYARAQIKDGLSRLSEGQQLLFKRMYAHGALGITENRALTEEELSTPVEEIVDKTPEEKLDWAMQQVKNTRRKRA